MQLYISRLALAAVLLVPNIWAAEACSDLMSAIAPAPTIEMTLEKPASTSSTAAEVEFAFPNWIRFADHEGDSFTSLSAAQLFTAVSREIGESEPSDGSPAAFELSLPRILVDDEGIPLFSFAEAYSAAEITGSTIQHPNDELAPDGYEDR
jgi:hypothetical protein